MGAEEIVWQHAQAYLPRMWRSTKNWAGTQSSCSLTSSPMRGGEGLPAGAVRLLELVVAFDAWQARRERLAYRLALGSGWRSRRLFVFFGGLVFESRIEQDVLEQHRLGAAVWALAGGAKAPHSQGREDQGGVPCHRETQSHNPRADPSHTRSPADGHRARVEDCPDGVEKLLRNSRSVDPSARNRQNGCDGGYDARHGNNGAARATAILQQAWGHCARSLEHQQQRAWARAA